MYVPPHFVLEDAAEINALLRDFNFALLVSNAGGELMASHVPLLYRPEEGTLEGHLARANPQCEALGRLAGEGGEVMAVFQGPHAYISPRYYASGLNVPTWNYLAVHVYGRPRLVEAEQAAFSQQERLVAHHEESREPPWSLAEMEERRARGMLRGILAFEIAITRIEAKAKLGQNKSAEDRAASAAALEAASGGDPLALATARLMRPE